MTGARAVILPVGADLYAVPMAWMREVLATPAVTPLVTSKSVVLGLINLRGEIVLLLDTGLLLGVGAVAVAPFAVVLNTPFGPVGLAATAFPERGVLDRPAGPSDLPGTSGCYRVDDRVAVLIDPGALLSAGGLGSDASTRAVLAGVG